MHKIILIAYRNMILITYFLYNFKTCLKVTIQNNELLNIETHILLKGISWYTRMFLMRIFKKISLNSICFPLWIIINEKYFRQRVFLDVGTSLGLMNDIQTRNSFPSDFLLK